MPVTLIARYHVRTGHEGTVQEALTRMAARVKADEPGCLLYQANRSTEVGNLFCLYEVYADEAFGPVAVLEPFRDFEAALEVVNASRFADGTHC